MLMQHFWCRRREELVLETFYGEYYSPSRVLRWQKLTQNQGNNFSKSEFPQILASSQHAVSQSPLRFTCAEHEYSEKGTFTNKCIKIMRTFYTRCTRLFRRLLFTLLCFMRTELIAEVLHINAYDDSEGTCWNDGLCSLWGETVSGRSFQ